MIWNRFMMNNENEEVARIISVETSEKCISPQTGSLHQEWWRSGSNWVDFKPKDVIISDQYHSEAVGRSFQWDLIRLQQFLRSNWISLISHAVNTLRKCFHRGGSFGRKITALRILTQFIACKIELALNPSSGYNNLLEKKIQELTALKSPLQLHGFHL